MKVVTAYLLAALGGKTTPSIDDIKGILGSVGADVDEKKIELLLNELDGKDLIEVIASGRQSFASANIGGGVAVTVPGGGGATPAVAEAKKEETVEEKAEESDDDMGFSLFD